MVSMIEPYDVVTMNETYRVIHESDGETKRIYVYSEGQLRFSLPNGTPPDEVKKFIQVYALGLSDGRNLTASVSRLVRRLGKAVGQARKG